ncbi:Ig-like domain-containing protein [Pseudoalteromonas rubra]|nr:Ig-like domain-containing protein [Pseudoalteromonas rubra]MEC4091728.1 Ig-like domain-containing protein [Pseudoalteromonas rubra]
MSASQADTAGNTSTAATQTITLDNAAPSALTITTPIETDGIVNAAEDNDVLIAGSGAESGNSVTVTITDNNSTVSRTVTADSSGNWTLSGSELDVSGLNNGTLTVSASQADTAGNTSTAATQTITLDNAAPSALTITTPIETDGVVNAAEDNDVLIAGSGAESGNSVTVTITDNNSSVSRTVTADSSGNWTLSGSELDVSGLNNGTLTVSATQADTAGNTSTAATQTITLDNAAPSALTITTPIETDGLVNAAEDNDVLIAGSGAESGNSVTVTITDNNSTVSRTVTADSSGNWTLSDSELDVSGLNNGTLTVSATQSDTAGNTSTAATQTITLDNAAPSALTITTPIETDGIVNAAEDNDVLIAGSGAESGNSVTVTITDNNSTVSRTVTADSSGNWTLSGSELDVSGLNNGTLTVSATQSDTAGNTSTAATQTITLDNAAPSAVTITTPIETDGIVNAAEDNDVLIAGSGAESGNSVTVTITDNNSSVSRTVTADSSGNWTLSGSELDVSGLNNGTLTVSATQSDTAGNTSTAATQSITLDNAAPSAVTMTTPIETDGLVNAAEDNDVLIAGSGAESGNSVTVTITDNNSTVSRTVTADSSGNWTLSGSELDVSGLNNGTLTVSATQTDTAGNTSTAATQSITLDNAAPSAVTITTPIETDGIVNAAEDNDVLIAGSGAESGNSVTVTITDNNSTVSRTVTADSSGNWTLSGSELDVSGLNNGTLTVSATQSDTAGNTSTAATQSITLDNAAPSAVTITTPIETDGIVNAAEDNDVLIAGSGAESGNSVTVTITDNNSSVSRTVTADSSGNWTLSGSELDVSGLNNGTLTVSATQTDTAGNASTAATQSITLDNAAPSAVSITTPIETDGLVNAAEDNDVLIAGSGAESGNSVTVTITDNNSTVSRTVTADSSGNWTLSGSELDVSGLNNGTLTVSATQTDTAGNTSTAATQTITLDNAAPSAVTITTPIETDGIVNAAEDNDVLIAGSGAESGNNVTVTITDNNSTVSRTVTADSSGNWTLSGSELDVSGLNNGTLTVSATQTDTAGNTSTAATQSITLDNAAPSAVTITTPIETDGIVNAAEDNDVLIAGSGAESGNSVTVTITDNNSTVSRTVTADSSGNWTLSGSELDVSGLNNGTLTVSATQTDTAGNTSTAATQSITLDNAAPSAVTITTPIETDGIVNAAEDNDVLIAGSGAESGNSVTVTITDNNSTVSRTVTADSSGNWTLSGSELDVSGLNNGTLTVSATQTDTAGNTSTAATQSITLDNAAPSALTITTPIETDGIVNAEEDNDVLIAGSGAESGNSVTVTITDNNSTVSRTVTADSSGNWTLSGSELDVSGLNNGTLTVSATQADTAGNTSTAATQTITLDNAAPSALTITTPIETDGLVNAAEDNDVLIAGSGAESGNSVTVTITDNNSTVSRTVTADSSGNWTLSGSELDVSGLNNGTLTVSATQTDTAGNTSTAATQSITLDNGTPSGQSVAIDQSLINRDNESALSFTLSGLEGSGTFTYQVSDGTNTVSSDSATTITASSQQVTGVNVSTLNEGTLTLTVIVSDEAGNAAEGVTASVTKKYNVAPVLSGTPASTINEDAAYSFTPTLTDSDDGDTHTFSIVNKPGWAEFDTATGALTGTPTDSDVGTHSNIQISVSDGTEQATLTAFSIEVNNTNDAPVGQDFTFTLDEEATLTVAAANGLLSTATDDDTDSGDTLTVSAVSQPQHGQLSLNADGSFSYQHNGSENHSDSFTFQVVDSSNATSATQTVTLTINAVADAPTTVNDTATTNEDEAVTFNLLSNDSDPEGDMVASSAAIVTQPTKGSVSIENGVVTYTPNTNANGQDTFTYTVKDAALNTSSEATATVTITAVNDRPTVQNFAVNIDEDNASDALAVRAGASDVEDGNPSGDIAVATQPTKGSVAIDQNAGTLVYTPSANETGTDSFTYTITDSEGSTSEPATVSVTIGAVNDKPIVAGDSVTTNEDVGVTLAILNNDSDVEDQGFNGANVTLEDQGNGAGSYAKADVSILADGSLQISPKQDENGTFSFTYTLTDSEGLTSDAATVTVTLTPVNDAPVAVGNTAEVAEEGSFEVNVLGNDTDVDENDSFNLASVTVVQAPASGQTQVNAAGAIVYTPNANFSGEDTFTYTVADAAGAVSNEATVTMTVTPVNDAPVISGVPATEVNEDTSYSFTPTSSDVDGDTLTFSIQNAPQWATFDTSTGTLSGTPSNDDVGSYQGIVISVTDGTETVSLTSFDITVSNTNDAPTISGTPATSVNEDTAYSFTPNASDVDSGDTLTFSIANQPDWASFDTQTGTLSGTPANEHVGTTSDIVISVSDGSETVALTGFSVTVVNTNDAPVISGTPATSVNEDSGYSFVPSASDVDVGDTLTFSVANLPSWASFSTSTGAISGIPGNANVGVYQGIVVSVSDGTETVSLDAFAITVINVNDAPVITGTPGTSVNEDSAYSFTPVASDMDGDSLTFSIANKPDWASFDTQTGTLSGTPENGDVGTSSDIVISVSDGSVSVSLSAFSLTVVNTNDAPEISGTPATSVNEDSVYSFTPSASDVDAGDVLTFSVSNKPNWASFNTATGTLSGTPTDSDVGTDTQIVITVSDGTTHQSLSAFDIEVVNTNDAPTAQDYSFGLDEGQLLTVTTMLGLLSNASDDDLDSGDSLSVSALSQPQHGVLTLNADGSFNYQHDGSESTSDSFTFQVTDAQNAASATHTVSLTINPVEDAPTAVDDSATTNEDTAVQIALLDNDSDPEGNMNAASAVVVTAPSKGAVSIVNGIATYTPADNENGQDSFTYTVADTALNTSEQATVVVTITPVNDAPVAANLTISTDEDTPSAALAVRAAATDVEDGIPTGTVTLTSTPSLGLVSLDQDAGTLVYTPNNNEVGEETFTYTVTDSDGLASASANITVNIGAINDRPVVGDDTVTTDEDVTVVLDILANDSDVEDQGFNGANVTLEDQGNGAGSYAKADVTILADGTLEIAPKQDETGSFSFTYTLTDSEGLASLPATVTVTLTPVNDAPVAVDNSVELQEEGAFEVNVLGNDFDVDEGDSFDLSSVTVVSVPQNGQTTVTAQGTIIYTANTNFFGNDSFTYTVRDQAGAVSNEATVSLSVTPINDAPVVEGQALSLNEDDTLLVTLSGTDPDADTLTYSIVSGVSSGALQQQSETTWLYTPNADFNGSDSFSFMANDGALDSNTATVTLTVSSVNDAPVISGTPDTSVVHNTLYSFTPQASDADGDALTFAITNQPVWAQFDTATGTLSGTPSRDDEGVYSNIVISVTDGTAQTALSAFEIDVQFVNNQPIANNMDIVVNEDGTTSFVADTSDEDGDTVTVSIERQPVSGQLVLQGNTFTYTPFGNFNGLDSFSYIANDGSLNSAAGEVKITINSVNDLPLAVNDSFVFEPQANNTYILDVLANDTDVDAGDVLSIVGAKASVGSVSIADGALSYQAQADTQGLIVIDYLIEDSQKARSKATAQLQINSAPANTLPVITVPTDITTNATGLFTKVSLGTATAVDGNGNTIAVSLVDGTTLFAPGTHFVYWQATDSQGLQSIATQNVFVNPLISLEKDTTVAEEQSHTVNVFLNGPAPSYPVTIPYTVSGSANAADHDLVDGQVVIESGTSAQISFNVFGDGVIEGNENIVITLADSLNRGAKSSSTVTIVEENVAPTVSTSVTQAGETRSLLTINDELVTVTATARDANPQDNVTLDWNAVDSALTDLSAEENTFVFSTSGLTEGIYRLTVTATDDAQPSLSSVSDIYLEVVAELQALTQVDTDGDLIPDDEEGYADSDGDGIPDFQDAITDCNVMQEQAAESAQYLVEGEPGVCLRKGATVAQNSTGGVQLLESELPGDGDAINIGGLFDFIATGLPQAGDTYTIVIPQRRPIPANAVYRKLKNDEWVDFVVSDGNAILSATGEPGYCPPPGSNEWTDGLTEGDWCVQLQIVDGGPNDDDGMANRSVVDPGGIAVPRTNNTLPVAVADEVTIASGQQITIDVLENDTDADGNALTITGATVDFGTVSIVDNKLVYTPPATFVGVATIEYSISDGQGGTSNSQAIVNLTVNSAPTAVLDVASTDDRTTLVIDVLANDTDADGDELFLISAVATHGKATINIDGTLTYEPKVGYSGEDVIVYQVRDSKGAVSKGIVKVTISGYQTVNVENKSSGGLGGLLVIMMSALILRRRRNSKLPAYTLLTTSCLLADPVLAEQWRVEAMVGKAEADYQAPTSVGGLTVGTVDDSSESWSAGAYYELMPKWEVGIRYIDLGQGRLALTGQSLTPDTAHELVARATPVLPEGFALQTGFELLRHERFSAALFLGAFDWEYQVDSTRNSKHLLQYEKEGTSAYGGITLGYDVLENTAINVSYSYYNISENAVNEISAGVSMKF